LTREKKAEILGSKKERKKAKESCGKGGRESPPALKTISGKDRPPRERGILIQEKKVFQETRTKVLPKGEKRGRGFNFFA